MNRGPVLTPCPPLRKRGEGARGVTLIELVVALAILGMIVGMSGVALATLRTPRDSEHVRELQQARSQAIRTGRPVITTGHSAPDTGRRLFLPDGRALGSGFDPLTGAPHAAR